MPEIKIDPKTKLFIATPCENGLHPAFVGSLLETGHAIVDAGFHYTIRFEVGDSLIERARNVLVAKFMAKGDDFTHFLFIDSDISWKPESVLRLLAATQLEDVPIACGVYPKKCKPLTFPCNFAHDEHRNVAVHPKVGYIELRDAPTGFLMIRRGAFLKLMAAYPDRKCQLREKPNAEELAFEYALFDAYIDKAHPRHHYLSEDFGFCRLWQAIGGKIWADPDAELTHWAGNEPYTGTIRQLFEEGPKTAKSIEGWMTEEELACLTGLAAACDSVTEIGSWKGRSTFALLSACKGPVYAVDHWKGSKDEVYGPHAEAVTGDVFNQFMQNVGHFPNLKVRQKSSLDAIPLVPNCDLVFIDGSHDYDSVAADIKAWRPKARKILCGHDYNWPGVKQAVDELVGEVRTVGSIWIAA